VLFAQYTKQDDAWIVAPLACAVSAAVMTLTGTVHPPGGAAAVLAVADTGVRELGWIFVGFVALSSTLMVCVACICGNGMARRYPLWWWSPKETGSFWKKLWVGANPKDVEKGVETKNESLLTLSVSGGGDYAYVVELQSEEWQVLQLLIENLRDDKRQLRSESLASELDFCKAKAPSNASDY
jgi:HPP family